MQTLTLDQCNIIDSSTLTGKLTACASHLFNARELRRRNVAFSAPHRQRARAFLLQVFREFFWMLEAICNDSYKKLPHLQAFVP